MDHHSEILQIILLAGPEVLTTQATTILIFILVILLILSFFIAGAQVAFFSLGYKDINMLKTKQQPAYKRIVNLLEDPKKLLASLFISHTLINIAIIILGNYIIDELVPLDAQLMWVKMLIKVIALSLILIMFGQVMPKMMATQNNLRFAKDAGPLVSVIAYLFDGISSRIVESSDSIEKKLSKKAHAGYNLEELDNAMDNRPDDTSSEKEKNILRGIVKFGNITVKQIMKTRLDVSGLALTTSFPDVIKRVEELHYSRLPVFKTDLDEVVGMIHTKDLLPYLDNPEFEWHSLMRPPYFIHEQKLIEDLLHEFQTKRIHFAIVVDEFGGTSGIVTLEDIMEEIIGEIRDEFDEEDYAYKKLDEFNYVFEGKMMINDVCRVMELSPDTFDEVRGNSDSLAGLVLEIAGVIPQESEIIPCGDFEFTVMEVVKNRLRNIKVTIKPQVES